MCAEAKRCIQERTASPESIIARHTGASSSLSAISDNIGPARLRWAASLPERSPPSASACRCPHTSFRPSSTPTPSYGDFLHFPAR